MGLIVFEGGPLSGQAYQTKDLLGLPSINLPLDGYVWTSERRTSAKTGAIAQVWRFRDPNADLLSTAAEEAPVTAAVLDSAPNVLPPGAEPWEEGDNRVTPDEDSPQPEEVNTPGVRPEPGDEEGDDEPLEGFGARFRTRRDAIKATRATVSGLAGLKPSRLVAIEGGTGRPVDAAERARLEEALGKLEQERGDAGDASAH